MKAFFAVLMFVGLCGTFSSEAQMLPGARPKPKPQGSQKPGGGGFGSWLLGGMKVSYEMENSGLKMNCLISVNGNPEQVSGVSGVERTYGSSQGIAVRAGITQNGIKTAVVSSTTGTAVIGTEKLIFVDQNDGVNIDIECASADAEI
jgi:hypothetical protein